MIVGDMSSEEKLSDLLSRLHTDKDVDAYLQENRISRQGETPCCSMSTLRVALNMNLTMIQIFPNHNREDE